MLTQQTEDHLNAYFQNTLRSPVLRVFLRIMFLFGGVFNGQNFDNENCPWESCHGLLKILQLKGIAQVCTKKIYYLFGQVKWLWRNVYCSSGRPLTSVNTSPSILAL